MAKAADNKFGFDSEHFREATRPVRVMAVNAEVGLEVGSARAKHGSNAKWPDGTGPGESVLNSLETWSRQGDLVNGTNNNLGLEIVAKRRTDNSFRRGTLTREMIVTEEWAEALAAKDEDELRAELIQLAAMCVDWVVDIDDRKRDR